MNLKAKYIFVTGGVTSSLGKGIVSASLGMLLQARGFKVTIQKFDPYINIDPGTLNPFEHGECYVTDDGAETDLDLGHYERFLNITTSQDNNITTGRIYHNVIQRERKGEFLGKTVQVIPNITDEIKRNFFLLDSDNKYDFIITEIGGSVGDIESLPFIEAVRQVRWETDNNRSVVIHLTLIPYLKAAKELKTKPTQHSVKKLLEEGVQPDILVCRTELPLPLEIRKKVSLFCNVQLSSVIEAMDVDTIYDVPMLMRKEKLDEQVLTKLNTPMKKDPDLTEWVSFLSRLKKPTKKVNIGLVGKYVSLHDAYLSIVEAFIHAGSENDCKVNIRWISAEEITKETVSELLQGLQGVLVAPGFGERGVEGKIVAIQYVREKKIPFFGICLGMQCAVVEFARNVLNLDANTTELNPDSNHPVIDMMENQKLITNKGGTMRLGSYECSLVKDSKVSEIYNSTTVFERHRHRYELNNKYLEIIEKAGLRAVGINPPTGLVEVVELTDHPWFIGVQFHPELKSRVINPHPLFVNFVDATLKINYH